MRVHLYNILNINARKTQVFKMCVLGEQPKYFINCHIRSKSNISRFASGSVLLLNRKYSSCGPRSNVLTPGFLSSSHILNSCNSDSSAGCFVSSFLSLQPRRCMAGHSKWQNIKHVKQSKDQEKARLSNKFAHLVRVAVREGGNADPKYNTSLRNILDEARKHNIPSSSLENALKKTSGAKVHSGIIEIPGPEGLHIILEYETDNVGTFRHGVKGVLKKYQTGIIPGEGRWRACYEQKGIVKVIGKNDDTELNAEQALDSAIEAGAEDVQQKIEDDSKFLEFISDPADLHPVKKALESMGYKIEEAYVAYIPNVSVSLSKEASPIAENLLSELEDLPDIVRLYENMK